MSLKDQVLPLVEAEVKSLIVGHSDEMVEALVKEVESLIPGSIDDMLLEPLKPKIEAIVKEQLLKLADKISPAV